MKHHHITIIYDSITNAVFKSQVITPLINKINQQPDRFCHLLSFEKNSVDIPHYNNISIQLFQRYHYLNSWSLWPAIRQVKQYIQSLPSYSITARGPFAGYIALHAQDSRCTQLIVQARGLAAQEYAYVHQEKYSWWHKLRTAQLHRLEKAVYSTRPQNIIIEAVSPALKQYLIETFNTDPEVITIAEHDLPERLPVSEQLMHRQTIRTLLRIPDNKIVYCYSGSYKPWQCPAETFNLFLEKYRHDQNCFLLILTPDIVAFQSHAKQIQLPVNSYHICSVDSEELLHYLTAADYGILLRKPHIINHVSRPTKAVEYRAAGLNIIHNNTVDYIK